MLHTRADSSALADVISVVTLITRISWRWKMKSHACHQQRRMHRFLYASMRVSSLVEFTDNIVITEYMNIAKDRRYQHNT